MKWERFGAKLGVGFCLVGFVLIFLGWNGAASTDRVPGQIPYVISGGLAGLGMIVLGAALISVESRREDHERLEALLGDVRALLERAAPPEEAEEPEDTGIGPRVVVGQISYHRPDCKLLEGREGLPDMSLELARERGLVPCRICEPARSATRPGRSRAPRKPRRRGGRRPSTRRR